jgi:hypothetical protein
MRWVDVGGGDSSVCADKALVGHEAGSAAALLL